MGILDILYPKRCPVCHGVLKGKDGICPDCRKHLHYITEPKCKKCGKQIEKAEEEYLNAKGLINSVFGMMVTSISKADIVYTDDLDVKFKIVKDL